jgi:transcriptional regulator with XRE-family HTH domain
VNFNQVVSYNLRRIRTELGMTQEQAAKDLKRWLGEEWSKSTWSIAENSDDTRRRQRTFDINELVAFSQTFKQPISYFLTPPDGVNSVDCGEPADVERAVGRGELLAALQDQGGVRVRTIANQTIALMTELQQISRGKGK